MSETRRHRTKRHRRTRLLYWGLALLVVLVVARLLLPEILRRFAESTLDRIEGYDSRIADVDVNLWRGAYTLEGLEIVNVSGDVPVPFFSAPAFDLSVHWSAVLDGALVGEIEVTRPELNFVAGPTEETSQTEIEDSWIDRVQELFPLKVNQLEIVDGAIHFRNFHRQPKVDVYLDQFNAVATNLTNSRDLSETLVASFEGHGRARAADVRVEGSLDPYAPLPTFDLAVSLNHLPLPALNDLLQAYGGVDAEGGTFAVYTEFQVEEGRFNGYVKPIFEGVDIVRWGEDSPFWKRLWSSLVAAAAEVLENQSEDRVATRIPLSGNFDDPDAGIFRAVANLLKNAFIEALPHGLDDAPRLQERLEGAADRAAEPAASLERSTSLAETSIARSTR